MFGTLIQPASGTMLARIEDDYRVIGQRLRTAREAQRLSQADLARVLGVEPETYGRYESGQRRITVPDLRRLAQTLDVGLDTLLGAEPPPPRSPIVLLRELEASIAAKRVPDPVVRAFLDRVNYLPPHRLDALRQWILENEDDAHPSNGRES